MLGSHAAAAAPPVARGGAGGWRSGRSTVALLQPARRPFPPPPGRCAGPPRPVGTERSGGLAAAASPSHGRDAAAGASARRHRIALSRALPQPAEPNAIFRPVVHDPLRVLVLKAAIGT